MSVETSPTAPPMRLPPSFGPCVGQRVLVKGRRGLYVIVHVDPYLREVNLQALVGPSSPNEPIPFSALHVLDFKVAKALEEFMRSCYDCAPDSPQSRLLQLTRLAVESEAGNPLGELQPPDEPGYSMPGAAAGERQENPMPSKYP